MNSNGTGGRQQHRPPTSPAARRSRPSWEGWQSADAAHRELFADELDTPGVGEIWTAGPASWKPEHELLLIVVTAVGETAVTVIPLSTEVRYATEWDLRIPPVVLGYPAIAEVKLGGAVAANQLRQRIGALPELVLDDLLELLATCERRDPLPPGHLPVGPPVLADSDERLIRRECRSQQLLAYLRPVQTEKDVAQLSSGALLTRCRDATNRDVPPSSS